MSRRISCAVVVWVVCQCSAASALLVPVGGSDPVANLSASGDWFATRESPVYLPIAGCWLNGAGHYYFAGETADLNHFLERTSLAAESEHVTSRYQQVSRHLVIHPGAAHVPDHLTLTPVERAQWTLDLLPSSDRDPDNPEIIRSLTIEVHVWIDDKIRLEDLTVPETFQSLPVERLNASFKSIRQSRLSDMLAVTPPPPRLVCKWDPARAHAPDRRVRLWRESRHGPAQVFGESRQRLCECARPVLTGTS